MDNQIFTDTDHYINELFAPEDTHLKAVVPALYAINSNMPEGSISANQGKLLQLMARLCNAKRILELGTLGGYSTIWMARALPADGKLISIEYNEEHARVAKQNITNAGLENIVEIRTGKCIDILKQMEADKEAPFDLIFMDADKPPYTEYFALALKMSRQGTIIIADNVIREGKVLNADSDDEAVKGVQRFNKMLAAHPAVTATIIQTIGIKAHDGMAIAVVN